MSQHTPGPWRVRAPKHDEKYGQLDWDVLSAKGTKVADVIADLPAPVCEANASLIASAPEMFSALREIAAGRLDFEHGFDDFHDRVRALAKAALAKAEGVAS